MTLHQLTDEFQIILNNLDEDGEPTESVVAQLQEVESMIKDKADGYVSLIKYHESYDGAIQEEIDRLRKRAASFSNKAKWLKQRLFDAMQRMGESKIVTTLHTIRISKNGGELPVEINPEQLTKKYQTEKLVVSPNREAILADLKAGKEVPGCMVKERGSHLRIS